MRVRIVLVLCVVLVCYVAVYGTVFDAVVYPRFAQLENEQALENLDRAVESLRREARRLEAACDGLAALEGPGNLEAAFAGGLARVLAADAPRFAAWRGPGAQARVRAVPAAGASGTPAAPPGLAALLETPAAASGGSGFLWEDGRPLLAAFRGGEDGRVLLAQALDGHTPGEPRGDASAPLALAPADPENAPPLEREALAALAGGAASWMRAQGGYVHAFALLPAPPGAGPGLILRASLPETLGERGRAAARMGAASGVLAGALILLALLAVLDAQIGSPLARFTRHVRRVRQERDLGARTGSTRADEIGLLSREFDAMLAEIEALHRELSHQAFRLGMAEAASGVLHELRNALAPLPGLLEAQRRGARTVSWENLDRAARELESGPPGAERLADLGAYLALGLARARQALEESGLGAARLGELFARVEAILMAYDAVALASRRVERLDPARALRDAARSLPEELAARLEITLDDSLDALPQALGNAQGLRLVAETLLALAARLAPEGGRTRVFVSGGVAATGQEHAADGLPVVVPSDSGALGEQALVEGALNGAAPGRANLARLRLRVEGVQDARTLLSMERQGPAGTHSPHWCANAMNAMGGSLRACAGESGASVVLDLFLPVATGESHVP